MRPIRTYEVTVRGFPPVALSARSPSKARAQCWRMYQSYDDRAKFKDFLRMSSICLVPDPPGIGERIKVGRLLATRVIGWSNGKYVHFMRDDGDTVLCSHPLDVTPAE